MSFLKFVFGGKRKDEAKRGKMGKTVVSVNANASDSEDSDDDTISSPSGGVIPGRYHQRNAVSTSCHAGGAVRRPGCDLMRSRLNPVEDEQRSSNSSTMHDDSGNTFTTKYRQIKSIRKGRVVNVLRAMDHQLHSGVILKCYQKQNLTTRWKDQHTREHRMLTMLQGTQGVAQLLAAFEDESSHYLVQHACLGSTLIETMSNQVGRFPEHTCALEVVLPLLRVLRCLHARGIVHRSLRPEHVMCSPGNVTLIDFSVAVDRAQHCLNSRAGSVEYMAPEVLTKPAEEDVFHKVLYCGMSEEELPSYDEKADIWSLGVVVYEVLTGVQPFFADTVPDMIALQAASFTRFSSDSPYPDFIAKQKLSANAQEFLSLALQLNPSQRASTAELLGHPWLSPESFRDAMVPRRSLSCNDAGAVSLRTLSLAGVDVTVLGVESAFC